jgi:hypothetical protein
MAISIFIDRLRSKMDHIRDPIVFDSHENGRKLVQYRLIGSYMNRCHSIIGSSYSSSFNAGCPYAFAERLKWAELMQLKMALEARDVPPDVINNLVLEYDQLYQGEFGVL